MYPCISECLSNILPEKLDFTIITTKQERFVTAILKINSISPPEKDKIYDLENPFGAKTKVRSNGWNLIVRTIHAEFDTAFHESDTTLR